MSHELRGLNYDRQEPGGSTSDSLMLIPKKTYPKSNRQESGGSTSDRINLILHVKKIRHICAHNKITAPFINNTHEIKITQKCNGMHRKYVDTTKNTLPLECNAYLF